MNIGNLAAIVTLSAWNVGCSIASRPQTLLPLTPAERDIAVHLRSHVTQLAGTIGPRNLQHPGTLDRARAYIEDAFAGAGYRAARQTFVASRRDVANIEAERPAETQADGLILFGAHYDSAGNSPGANDNASGVAVLLGLARAAGGPITGRSGSMTCGR